MLGSTIQSNSAQEKRSSAGRVEKMEMRVKGVICGRRIAARMTARYCKMVVRPAVKYNLDGKPSW